MLKSPMRSTQQVHQGPDENHRNSLLARLLRDAHDQSKLPGAVVAGLSGISESYLSKLLVGCRRRPSRDVLLILAYVWGIRYPDEVDRILEAAGHPKLSRPLSWLLITQENRILEAKADLPSLLQEMIARSGLSYRELSSRLGLSVGTISLIAQGKRHPSRDAIVAIGYECGCEREELDCVLRAVGYSVLMGDGPVSLPIPVRAHVSLSASVNE
jgi:hypothetical protein